MVVAFLVVMMYGFYDTRDVDFDEMMMKKNNTDCHMQEAK